MRVLVGLSRGHAIRVREAVRASTISIRVAQAHPTCHGASLTRASVSAPEMGSSPQLIFSVDPID
jgi:hypothetical protein